MLIISQSLSYVSGPLVPQASGFSMAVSSYQNRYFVCCECYAKVAHYNAIFAMSKQGIQSNFCNPGKTSPVLVMLWH